MNISAMLREERGAGLLEYALIVSLIAVASITGLSMVGRSVSDTFDAATASLSTVGVQVGADNRIAPDRGDGKEDTTIALKDTDPLASETGLRVRDTDVTTDKTDTLSQATTVLSQANDSLQGNDRILTADTGADMQNPGTSRLERGLRIQNPDNRIEDVDFSSELQLLR